MTAIQRARLERELSITSLGLLAGIQTSYLSRIERGIQLLTPTLAFRLSRILGIPAEELIEDSRVIHNALRQRMLDEHLAQMEGAR